MGTGAMAAILLPLLLTSTAAQSASRLPSSHRMASSGASAFPRLGEKIKGMAFGTGVNTTGIRNASVVNSMRKLMGTGVNYVHVSAYARMRGVFDLRRYAQTSERDIRYQIRLAKRNGARVFFKPVVEPDTSWRGFIPGRDEWLRGDYKSFIVEMAKIAEEEEVDLFAVGSEYAQSLSNERGWRFVVEEVRKVFSGRLTYVGNHDVRFPPSLPSPIQMCVMMTRTNLACASSLLPPHHRATKTASSGTSST